MLREKHHHVSTTADLVPLVVNGDPARLVQCVANLLTNAIKYTDPHGQIRIETRAEADDAVISVTDNGTGIAADLLPQIFDLFVQSKRTLDRAQGGLGIGLSVVKRLVEMHGGQVSASSPGIGQGATVTIRLPRVAQDSVTEPAARVPRVPALRTLVVDDNHDAAESLAMLLSLDGHEVQAVFTAEDALERAHSFRPQVMLLDIGLPGMDGFEVARRVRALEGGSQIRLVALTGYGQNEDRQRALAAGFDEHLVKPVEPDKLAADSRARLKPPDWSLSLKHGRRPFGRRPAFRARQRSKSLDVETQEIRHAGVIVGRGEGITVAALARDDRRILVGHVVHAGIQLVLVAKVVVEREVDVVEVAELRIRVRRVCSLAAAMSASRSVGSVSAFAILRAST